MNILNLIRYKNLIFVFLVQTLIYTAVVLPIMATFGITSLLPSWTVWVLMLATVLIAAGGYVINDYFDMKIDRINRPDKVIVGHSIDKQTSMRIYQILTGLGVILGVGLSAYMKNMTLGFIFVVVPGMLWFYSASYKRQLIIGNLIVAVAAALVPLIPLIAESGALQNRYGEELLSTSPVIPILYKWVFAYSVFFFFFTFISEVIKDMRDQDGDREMECHTVPIVWGENKARIFVSVLTIIAVLLIGWAAFFGIDIPGGKSMTIRYFLFGIGVPSICMIYILWLNSCNAYKNATTLVWFIMAVGLLYSVFHYYLLAKIQGLTFFGLFNIA